MLRHALVERDDLVAHFAFGLRIVKDADDRRIPPFENAGDAAKAAPVGTRRREFHQHLVTLHGAIDLVGRDEDVVFFD